MNRCAAAWIELNMSGPDNRVTACCYYAGETDEWGDTSRTMDDYWNSARMRYLRRLQTDMSPPEKHGCSGCHLYANRAGGIEEVYDLSSESLPAGLSPKQEENWRLSQQEYRAGADVLACRPARVYANFGFACNISCTMCHQVPRRLGNRRTMSADQLLSWGDDVERARQMIVIGGEPFVLPEAVRFIRGFIGDESRYEAVRLAITTNGTVLHKHWKTIHQKRRVDFVISLDGVGKAFETVRLRANWADVERNVLRLMEARSTDRPEWEISTASLIQKSTLRNLPEFARWHVRHQVPTLVSDFISAPGVEDTFYRENFLHNPELLADVPDWREYFDEAISVFSSARRVAEVNSLTFYKARVEEALAMARGRLDDARVRRARNDWIEVRPGDCVEPGPTNGDWSRMLVPESTHGVETMPVGDHKGMMAFLRTRLGDQFSTRYIGLGIRSETSSFRVRLYWSGFASNGGVVVRRAHAAIQQEDGREVPTHREYVDFGVGSELVLSGAILTGTRAIRVVLTPVGEEVSLLPRRIEVEFDAGTETTRWPLEIQAPGLKGSYIRPNTLRDAVARVRGRLGI